jgi:NADPH:quinone reductase-like Zn-dependent oxidoreductase
MKAVTLSAYGSTDKLELSDVPEPKVGPNDVKVRMAGASINPIDWKLRSGAMQAMMPLVFPAVLGRDVSGEVVAIGSAVSHLKVGARVMGLVTDAYAELVVAPAEAWTEVPATMDLVDAAALPLVLLTGAQLIEEAVRVRKGDVILVTGAVGSVGRAAVFVAKAAGAQVWAGVRASQKAEAISLGAHGVIALDRDDDLAKIPLLDAIADTIGGPTLSKLFVRMKPGGTIGTVVGDPAGAKELGLVVRGAMTHPDAPRLGALAMAVAAGELVIPISKRFPLAEARKAQDLAEDHAGGKVILTGPVVARAAVRGATGHDQSTVQQP